MHTFGGRGLRRRALGLLLGCLLFGFLVPTALAQDEPAFVFPCADGAQWEAGVAQPITFLCGWGTQGGPGLMLTFLRAHQATLTVEDEQGDTVLSVGPAEFATLWSDPEQGPSGFEDVTCAGPNGQGAFWSYLLGGGLPEGTYTVTLAESLRHPVNDGMHTCANADGTRAVPPPSLSRGSTLAVSTLIVAD